MQLFNDHKHNALAAEIARRGVFSKLELKDGELAGHVGCAFDNWATDRKYPVPAEDAAAVRDKLVGLGFSW